MKRVICEVLCCSEGTIISGFHLKPSPNLSVKQGQATFSTQTKELGGKTDIVGQIREIVLVGKALAVQAYDFSNGFYRFNLFDVFCCSVNMILQLAQTEFCVTMTGTGFATVTLKG